MEILKGKTKRIANCLIYGSQKAGKTTLCANAPKPIFIQTEDGQGDLEIDRFPMCETFTGVLNSLRQLAKEKHDYKTVVLDSGSNAETLIHKHLCDAHNEASIAGTEKGSPFAYHKGYIMAAEEFEKILMALNYLRSTQGMHTVIIAHDSINKVSRPDTEDYDRFEPDFHKHISKLVNRWADVIAFVDHKIKVRSKESGFGKVEYKAIGGAERVIYCDGRPQFISGSRFSMPAEIDYTINNAGDFWKLLEGQKENEK